MTNPDRTPRGRHGGPACRARPLGVAAAAAALDRRLQRRSRLHGVAGRALPPRVAGARARRARRSRLAPALRRVERALRARRPRHSAPSSSPSRVAVDLTAGQGLEAAARDARYRALGELLAPGEWLLTAHHGDDQLETLLLRLLRGTGVRGLRGIIAFGPFGARLARPAAARLHARASCARRRSPGSSLGSRIRRTRSRATTATTCGLHVLPALLARWPRRGAARRAPRRADERGGTAARRGGGRGRAGSRGAVARAASGARRADAGAAAQSAALLAARRRRSARRARARSRSCALRCSSARRARARSCVGRAAKAAYFARPCISGRRCRRARRPTHAARIGLRRAAGPAPKAGSRSSRQRDADGLPESWLAEGLTLRFRAGGERFRPRGRPHHSLKHLFQESGVVPWMRGRVPLLYRGGLARCDRRPVDQRGRRRRTRRRAALARAMDRASARACTGTALAHVRASRGWSGRGTFGTLQYRLDAPNTQLRWPDDGFPWEGRPALPVLT